MVAKKPQRGSLQKTPTITKSLHSAFVRAVVALITQPFLKQALLVLEWRALREERLRRELEERKARKTVLSKKKLKFELTNEADVKAQIRNYKARLREKARARAKRTGRG